MIWYVYSLKRKKIKDEIGSSQSQGVDVGELDKDGQRLKLIVQ